MGSFACPECGHGEGVVAEIDVTFVGLPIKDGEVKYFTPPEHVGWDSHKDSTIICNKCQMMSFWTEWTNESIYDDEEVLDPLIKTQDDDEEDDDEVEQQIIEIVQISEKIIIEKS